MMDEESYSTLPGLIGLVIFMLLSLWFGHP
jgi:hypothetical protein